MIAAITVPTLTVRGTRSTYLGADRDADDRDDARRAAAQLDAGHNVQLDQPQALADAVVAFGRSAAH